MRKYHKFVVKVEEQKGMMFPLTATFGGFEWPDSIPSDLPLLTDDEIKKARRWIEKGFIDPPYARDIGSRLFQTLFPPPIYQAFRDSFRSVAPKGEGLRLVLQLPPSLSGLPWELMYDGKSEHQFLARSKTAPIVRHLGGIAANPHPRPEKLPIRILIVTSSPEDYSPVGSEKEIEEIKRQLEKRRVSFGEISRLTLRHLFRFRSLRDLSRRMRHRSVVDIDVIPHATKEKLEEKISAAKEEQRGYHVIHFIGHGYADHEGGKLLFERDQDELDEDHTKNIRPVDANHFAESINDPTVNLVILNACETASPEPFYRDVTQEVFKRGVPSVIGMQVKTFDRAAIEFARDFYGAWASGEPIEGALAYARRLASVESPGAAADWGIPVLYMMPIDEGLSLDLPIPPFRWPALIRVLGRIARKTYRWIAALVAIVALIFVGIPNTARTLRLEAPIIRCAFPYPMSSEHNFNVVVNEFTTIDDEGVTLRSSDGIELADWLYHQMNASFEGLDLGTTFEIRPPSHTCPIEGNTREERAIEAEQLAEKILADVVIYGVIRDTEDEDQFSPEFYINYKGFEQAVEVVGPFRMGDPLLIDLPFDPSDQPGVKNPALSARAEALSLITVGLAYYVTDDFEYSLKYFSRAESIGSWLRGAGKEVIYLLLGNANVGLASQEKSSTYMAPAISSYEESLEINPDYARAKVGQAGAQYLQALGNPDDPSFDTVDLELLDAATLSFEEALGLSDAPLEANIEAKVAFGLGQIDLVRARIDGNAWLERAQEKFENVIREYEDGNESIRALAGHSLARLGAIALMQEDPDRDTAAENYLRATDLVTPYWKAFYFSKVGDIYIEIGNPSLAIENLDQCRKIAEVFGHSEIAEECNFRANDLRGGD